MGLAELYDYYWNEYVDHRTVDLPFMRSPITIPVIIFSYLYFVLGCGPRYMKNRKPYELKTFIRWYNILQIISNAAIVQQMISVGWFTEITVFCEKPDYSNNPKAVKLAYIMWFVMITKLTDLIETGVFVLRKKNNQISFLHVYHHVSTLIITWLIVRYVPVAGASFPYLINCSIHVIMYTYYLLSSFGPTMQRLLKPIKPFITIIQMVQFIGLILYALQPFTPSCDVIKTPSAVLIVDLIINFVLFYNFYKETYVKPAQKMK